MKFKSIKGTKDILPDECHNWQHVESVVHSIMNLFNYKEIRTPVFEETELFTRSIGELTDIVGKEMYTFTDRSGKSITLKPEMTAAVMRSYIQNNLGELQPLVKVYYIAPMFRQERPQAGRLRQFHQFGAEAIGADGPAIDAEVIALSLEVYKKVNLKNFELQINSVGCEKCRPKYKDVLKKYLHPLLPELSEESKYRFTQNPMRILDSKNEQDKILTKDAPLMKDNLCNKCADHFKGLQENLKSLNIDFTINGRIVRGLDYYTKTAFEIICKDLGSQDALAGGGRYDLLIKELGGQDTPSVGFAGGIERLLMALEKQNIDLTVRPSPKIFLVSADEAGRQFSLLKAIEIRRAGISCEIDFLNRSVKSQMRDADRQNAENVIVVGQDEINKHEVKIKNMKDGTEISVSIDNIIDYLKKSGQSFEKRQTS